jgi:hypothetical protein
MGLADNRANRFTSPFGTVKSTHGISKTAFKGASEQLSPLLHVEPNNPNRGATGNESTVQVIRLIGARTACRNHSQTGREPGEPPIRRPVGQVGTRFV